MKFTIECEMSERWTPYFLAMLTHMQNLGNIGSSRIVCLYADGGGDFRPKFSWDEKFNELVDSVKPEPSCSGNVLFDAG